MMTAPQRRRLPNRRPAETYDLEVGGMRLAATVGLFAEGLPGELFLSGAKDGSGLAAILADVSVVISVALRPGFAAGAGEVGRPHPEQLEGPSVKAASVIGPRSICSSNSIQGRNEPWRSAGSWKGCGSQ